MTRARLTITIAALAVLAAAGLGGAALAGGGPPPSTQLSDPVPGTVVATGSAQRAVLAPARRSDRSIDRAVVAARERALPAAVAAARREAVALGRSASLRVGRLVAIRRDVVAPPFSNDDGRFGPGRWCGRIFSHRTVRRADGSTRRVAHTRHSCQVPKDASVRVTATFAAAPAP